MSATNHPSIKTAMPSDVQDQLAKLRTDQERIFAELHAGEQHFKKLARAVWRVQEDERRRLARDLHDGIGQNLTALAHRIDTIRRADALPKDLAAHLDQASELCHTALEDTRALSRLLRPQILDDLGLAAALQWLGRQTSAASGVEVELDIGTLPEGLDNGISTLVFRVAQEALANVMKHAQASHVILRVAAKGPYLTLIVADDGVGCDAPAAIAAAAASETTGLSSMRERVRLFGGEFTFSSQAGEGSKLRVVLPTRDTAAMP